MPSSPLIEALHSPVTPQARLEIVRQLWPDPSPSHSLRNNWNAYFNFYARECRSALVEQGQHLCAQSHVDLLKIARLLENEPTKDEAKLKIGQIFPQHGNDSADVSLATRILAMVKTGPLPTEFLRHSSMSWSDGEQLRVAVHAHFKIDLNPDFEDCRFESHFTARNIERVTKISIQWTDNLVDHLRLAENDQTLCIFHHASFLKHMEHVQSSMYPENFVQETLATLALLFPSNNQKTKKWLMAQLPTDPMSTDIDLGLLDVGWFKPGHASLRLKKYKFWRVRLEALKYAFDRATPPSTALYHALRDPKKEDSWLNSWTAVVAIGLTLFFGLVQSVEGAVQVWKAYHPTAG